jgi:glycine/D-amino acid oxidase-like deaminating enzyme
MSDVIVVGLGADGSAAAAEVARRGERVLGIEAFPRGHTLGSAGELRSSKVYMYTISPDEHFVIGTDGPIVYASACSGHGFKFSSVMGEVLADLATTGRSRHDIQFLSRARFAA